jgi:hypothetical protein
VPCLIRRAALHHVGVDDGRQYGIDIGQAEIDTDGEIAADLRALLDCLEQVRTPSDIASRVALAGPLPLSERASYAEMVGRGLQELRRFVADKGGAELAKKAGLG